MSRRSWLIWGAVSGAIVAAVGSCFLAAAGDESCPWLTHVMIARCLVGGLSFMIMTFLIAQLILHFLYPPDIRFLRFLSYFIMSITGTVGLGAWGLIPISRLDFKTPALQFNMTVADAATVSVPVITVGYVTLIILAKIYIGRVEAIAENKRS